MNSSLGLDPCYNISSGKFQQHFDCTPWYLWRYKKTLVKILFNESLQFTKFSHSVVSDSLWPHELQHTRPPCPSPTPRVHPNPCPIESVMPSNLLFLCHPLLLPPSIFPSIRVFLVSQLFASGGQSIWVSASTSVLPMNTQDWSPLG